MLKVYRKTFCTYTFVWRVKSPPWYPRAKLLLVSLLLDVSKARS